MKVQPEHVFPADVQGWLTPQEGALLRMAAAGKRVLEVGSYCGRSTICLAQTATDVDCVDTFKGDGTPAVRDTYADFAENVRRYGVLKKIVAHRGKSRDILAQLPQKYNLAFIDGSHDYASVMADTQGCLSLLAPGGLLAFHDYKSPRDPEVTQAVNRLIAFGARLRDVEGTVAIIDPVGLDPAAFARPKVVVAMPHYGPMEPAVAKAFYLNSSRACQVAHADCTASLLANSFNNLWLTALNMREQGFQYFAMLHADILPGNGWVDTLHAELSRLNADIVSAVVPIKDGRGVTSTAIDDPADPWEPLKRLTMREVMQLPETFTAEDAGFPGHRLLLNTGCWIADMTRDWAEHVKFTIRDRILREGGTVKAQTIPEDWSFSRQVQDQGGKVFATRKVELAHIGKAYYGNTQPWGAWHTDQAYAHKTEAAPA